MHRSYLARRVGAALIAACAGSWPGWAGAAPYGFEDQPIGVQTPFAAAIDGVTATFSGPAVVDPGAFAVSFNSSSGPFPAPYRTLTQAFLTVGSAFGAAGAPLRVAFSAPVTSISVLFALDDPGNTTRLNLTTDTGGAASAGGALAPGFRYPEGSLTYTGAPFTVATLSSGASDFQLDDLTVGAAPATAVPAPPSLAVLTAGLAGLAASRRRRAA